MLHTDLIAPIPDLLRRHAAARGEKVAYRDAQTSVTYAALLERTGKLAGHLADKVPHSVHFIAEIPRTGSGKIIRYKLREIMKA
jgi:acyl-CoA synthetase (AMP-forming)/AMP-acid ligase II